MALALLPVVVFGALSVAVIAIAHSHAANHPSTAGGAMAITWGIAGLACGTACVLACRAALFATPVAPDRLRVALVAGTTVTLAMLAIAAATALYAVALSVDASHLAGAPNGPFQVLSVTSSLILQLIVMMIAGGLAFLATTRAWRAESQLASG
jgi:hypothetical protein